MWSGRPLTWSAVAGTVGLAGTTCLCGPTLAIAGLLSSIGIPVSVAAVHAYAMGVQRFFGPIAEPLLVVSLVLVVVGLWQRGPAVIALSLAGGSLTLIGLHRFLNTFTGRVGSPSSIMSHMTSTPAMPHMASPPGMIHTSPASIPPSFTGSAALAVYFLGLALIVASFVLAYKPLRGAHAS